MVHARERFIYQTQLIEREQHRLFVENTHHHRPAERGRNDAHAQVDVAVLRFDLEAAVLG